MSELAVGSLAGLAANSYVIDVASGSQLTQPGMVLQVVSTTKTDTFSASLTTGAFTAITGLSASITPSSATSKILIQVDVNGALWYNSASNAWAHRLKRDATVIGVGDSASARVQASSATFYNSNTNANQSHQGSNFLDEPATTSSVTYSVDVGNLSNTTLTAYINRSVGDGDTKFSARNISSITLMEIAG